MLKNAEFVVLIGTRPELIKLAPVVRSLRAAGRETVVVYTGQHKELLGNLWETFGLFLLTLRMLIFKPSRVTEELIRPL